MNGWSWIPDAPKQPITMLVGPTAIGKTELAIQLANRWGAEIISADAFQVYRGMDIGTAKLPMELRQSPKHHLIDVCDPTDSFTLHDYLIQCRNLLQITDHPWVICGGTGLYASAVLFQYDLNPPSLHRDHLEARYHAEGALALWHDLRELDPMRASQVSTENPRRLIRALDVAMQGKITASKAESPRSDIHVMVMDQHREVIHQRIHTRVKAMLDRGLVDEVQQLVLNGVNPAGASFQAIGYKETAHWLDAKIRPLSELEAMLVTKTRQFAKRQQTWFRQFDFAEWIIL